MKLVANVLERAINKRKSAKTELQRMKIADKWFERNADITLDELIKAQKENE